MYLYASVFTTCLYIVSIIAGAFRRFNLIENIFYKIVVFGIYKINWLIGILSIILVVNCVLRCKVKSIFLKIFLLMLSVIPLFISWKLLLIESFNYSNYVYTKYGVEKSVLVFSTSVFFICTIFNFVRFINFNLIRNYFYKLINIRSFILIILIFESINQFSMYPSLLWGLKPKPEYIFGNQYSYVKDLIDNTDRDCMIIHPPQSVYWPSLGNEPVLRYFLFPRKLLSGNNVEKYLYSNMAINEACFPVINDNLSKQWPVIDFKSNNLYFDINGQVAIKFIKLDKIGVNTYKAKFRI